MKHLNIKIQGKVHGVGFRYNAHKIAAELGLTGFVQNQNDGSVYIEAEGEGSKLQEFAVWCKKGPAFARVDNIEIWEDNIRGYSLFEIK